MTAKKTVIVVGAGCLGAPSANSIKRKLGEDYNVKLINASDYFYFVAGAIRAPMKNDVDPVVTPLKDHLDEGVEFIKDVVTFFDEEKVVLKSGEEHKFDALVITTGAKWASPVGSSFEFGNDHKAHFEQEYNKLKNAKEIVLIGGGFVNIEFVGEIYAEYEDEIKSGKKKISIIHSSDKLLPDSSLYSDKLRKKVTQWCEERNIKLFLNSKGVQSKDSNKVIINGEETIEADVVYVGTGIHPIVPENNIKDLTNKSGFIRVEKSFKVIAAPKGNIFAAGDVNDFNYSGLLKLANWVKTLSSNVVSTVTKGPNAVLVDAPTFENQNIPSVVSLGPTDAVGQLPLPVIGTVIAPKFIGVSLKSKDLFAHKWKSMVFGNA